MKIIKYLIIIFIGYIFGQIGLKMTLFNNLASPIWPFSGFAVALLVVGGRKYWPVIFIAALLTEMSKIHYSISIISVLVALSCTAEAIVAHILYEFFHKRNQRLENYNHPLSMIVGGSIASFVGACLGITFLNIVAGLPTDKMLGQIFTWWSGDFIGILTTAPIMIIFTQLIETNKNDLFSNRFKIELGVIFLFGLVLSYLFCFVNHHPDNLMFIFPIILFIAYFGNSAGMYLFVFLLQIFTILATHKGYGPFSESTNSNQLVVFQLFLARISIVALIIDSMIKSAKDLRQSIFVMFIGWSLTLVFIIYFDDFKEKQNTKHFENLTKMIESKIQSRFQDYIHILQSGSALFKADKELDLKEWREYALNLDLINRYPGINGIGIILPFIKGQEKITFQKFKKLIPFPMPIKNVPTGEHVDSDLQFNIIAIEPIEKNGPALGLNIGSEKNRRAAAELAIEKNEITMTNKIYLVQDKIKRPGFLMFLPIFSEHIQNNATLFEKQNKFVGFSYAPFVTEKFFSGVIDPDLQNHEIDFSVNDFSSLEKDNVLYESNTENKNPILSSSKINLGSVDYRILWKKGPAFTNPFSNTSGAIAFFGIIISLLLGVVTSMITSIKERAEELAIQNEAEASKQRAINIQASRLAGLGEMAAGLAHEVNNPLAIIQGKSQQLLRLSKTKHANDSELSESVQSIISNTQRIAKIIKGLRTFARDGESDPFVATNIASVIEDTVNLCQSRFKNHEIDFRTPNLSELDSMNLYINCRPTQIGQILLNLLNNSFDAVENKINPWIELKIESSQKFVSIYVVDSGNGIEKDLQDKIMQPFFTTKEVGKGTGLGLSIAQGIVQAHKGIIKIDNTHKNTCFVIQLPRIVHNQSSKKTG